MSRHGALATRMKAYEAVSAPRLVPNAPMLIRVDGRAFHTLTRRLGRPFDQGFIDSMVAATVATAAEMSGFKLAYVQSDEATFALSDHHSHQASAWFDGEVVKLASITASCFAVSFDRALRARVGADLLDNRVPAFDGRAFTVPAADAANAFVWRQQDWTRNSMHMLARSQFSHAQLQGRNRIEIHEMLRARGIDWTQLPAQLRNGTFVHPGGAVSHNSLDYLELSALLGVDLPETTHATEPS